MPTEQVEAAHETAAPAPTLKTTTGEASVVGATVVEALVVSFVGEELHGGALEVAPQGSIAGGCAPPSSRREPPAMGEHPIQPVGMGRDIVASGSAVALN